MSKIAIVYWSGTGNTQTMAEAVKSGAESSGASVDMFSPSEFNSLMVSGYDAIAFGCPAMGAEVLEETEFDPMFSSIEGSLSGKNKSGVQSHRNGTAGLDTCGSNCFYVCLPGLFIYL